MTLDDATIVRLGKLLGLLGSDQVGERAAAALKATELLHAAGLSWGEFVELMRPAVSAGHRTPPGAAQRPQEAQARPDTLWAAQAPKDGRPGFWRRHLGVTISVRQCTARPGYEPGWTASLNGSLLRGGDGRPVFYATLAEAQEAAGEAAFAEASC